MPKRNDINKILIIGAGPIVIGQACEFDYSGAQACKSLKEEGFKIILVNSNPATIMTDPEIADKTYVEPITKEFIEKIIKIEKPDALLPTMGGQTALNVSMELFKSGILKKNNIKMIGANPKSIELAEDREKFKIAMDEIGLSTPKSLIVNNIHQAIKVKNKLKLPLVIRPSFTLGGTGGGLVHNNKEFINLCKRGILASPTNQILIEKSVAGWKEYEMEVIRDSKDNCIIVCSIENVDPMGIHTGDSITVAPILTLTDKEYQILRNASIKVLRKIGVDTGGSNVQFAINPKNGEINVIEMNPRVSRSSALASKATGFPIAKIAAKLAVGYTLDELKNDITKTTPASFEPSIDYIVTKIPRFTFEKFSSTDSTLTTSMKSVGETMSIGRNFCESLQKGFTSLEYGLDGLDLPKNLLINKNNALENLRKKSSDRLLVVGESLRLGYSIKQICKETKYDYWFVSKINEIIKFEKFLKDNKLNKQILLSAKKLGFSDKKIAKIKKLDESYIRKKRYKLDIRPVFRLVDTCAGEFNSKTPYLYSTYDWSFENKKFCESNPSSKNKVIILGGGPNRIGQGIEFDYCCVHAVYGLREIGIETIMINCNPETVSTDYDTADRLYFEPLNAESVIEIYNKENQNGKVLGIFVQFGGQTPLKIAKELENQKIKILGTSTQSIDLAEDRDLFSKVLKKIKIQQPLNGIGKNIKQIIKISKKIGYPILVRPSYVLGGRAMEIARDEKSLKYFSLNALKASSNNSILIDQYLTNAKEIDVDLIRDKKGFIFIAGIMEHIEEAGVHSGDSACSIPTFSINSKIKNEIIQTVKKIAKKIKVVGLMNTQIAIKDNKVYVLEVNPRASRTIPFVAKSIGIPIVKIAAKVMLGLSLKKLLPKSNTKKKIFTLKGPVFPFNKFDGVEPILGPEMKSTGEVMGVDKNFIGAFIKSQIGSGINLPKKGNVFLSIDDDNKHKIIPIAKLLSNLKFKLFATKGTKRFLKIHGINSFHINKVEEGSPHIVELLINSKINLVINTTKTQISIKDSFSIRRTALMNNIPYFTNLNSAKVGVKAIKYIKEHDLSVMPLQSL
ncbi:MAG: Carbamoyl-phosphate synthase large chain [Alphaproteobacteria bacterium MarineAlpha5_Bin9]|nr:MAG: Carbamoyl-phosphate synthase large chain [Alphaproteobacteria bacterium MarineAlpha5_Bin9]|tara:strand:- start:1875 stop:5099 length:3225 start_codon:yes stop_codon:yes gene_type:complete